MNCRHVQIGVIVLVSACASARAIERASALEAPRGSQELLATLVITRDGLGQACPIGRDELLTARHVVESFTGKLFAAVTWSQGAEGGIARVEALDVARDLALLRSDRPVPVWYRLADVAPTEGTRVRVVASDYRRALAATTLRTQIVRAPAGLLVISESLPHGFSGACVFDEKTRAVYGLVQFVIVDQFQRRETVASALWGEWGRIIPEKPGP